MSQCHKFESVHLFQLESIKDLESFLVKHKKDYKDLPQTTEQERDNIEHEVALKGTACLLQRDLNHIALKAYTSTQEGYKYVLEGVIKRYNKIQCQIHKFFANVAYHKVKILLFSSTGERAAPFLRKLALEYSNYVAFANILWTEEDSQFW